MSVKIDMTVITNGKNSNNDTTCIVFKNDEERIKFAEYLLSMNNKPGPRVWMMYPEYANPREVVERAIEVSGYSRSGD